MIHELKSWPREFEAVASGKKRFEVRVDDRGFGVGDILRLREWDPAGNEYTGREVTATVTYVLRGHDEASPIHFTDPNSEKVVVMSIVPQSQMTARATAIPAPAGA